MPYPRKRQHSSRNQDCPAQLVIIIKSVPKHKSRAKNPDVLAKEWPCHIIFRNTHNHTIDSATALLKRPIGESTKKEIVQYFERGHSVMSAYRSFCLTKMEERREKELGDQYNNIVSDRYYFPKKTDFSNLFKKRFKERDGDKMFEQLEENLTQYPGTLWKISNIDEYYTISLCTPIMQRTAQALVQSSEILFITSTSSCDAQNHHKMYFFEMDSPVGGLPVGCIITTSRKSTVLDAVKNLLDIMPFKISPSVIFTNDMVEISILETYWPTSTLLFCTFHILREVWKWLQQGKNNIAKHDRQTLYQLFRNILFSMTEEELKLNIDLFNQDHKYPHYKKYIDSKLAKIELWCLFYRRNLTIRGSDTYSYDEILFRLLKDTPLEGTKAFNLTQLVDFVVISFETYYKQRLLDLVWNKINSTLLLHFLAIQKDDSTDSITEIGSMQYYVFSTANNKQKYFVDMKSNVCSCLEGKSGKICKHQLIVMNKFNVPTSCNTLSIETRKKLYFIATGEEPSELLLALKSDDSVNIHSTKEAGNDSSTLNEDSDDASTSCTDINMQWNKFIVKFDNDIRKSIESDPTGFIPAVALFINNYNRNMTSPSKLMNGLLSSFK